MKPSTINTINHLPPSEKREIYTRLIPDKLIEYFELNPLLIDSAGNDLFDLHAPAGSSAVAMSLYHEYGFQDPVLYGHLTDTLNGQIHVLLYVVNNPNSQRYDVDRMPDGSSTKFGTLERNLPAEEAAMLAGLAPGQIRKGLRMLSESIAAFEKFVHSINHEMFFTEPLYYHNAVIFERYGFAYQQGQKLMKEIELGFSPEGKFLGHLDGSTPFRQPHAANSCRLRSWAIHDGLLGKPFTDVTMYKVIGKHAGISTCTAIEW
jgi:acetoin utilization protein AcuC